jgi:hypothetical protein
MGSTLLNFSEFCTCVFLQWCPSSRGAVGFGLASYGRRNGKASTAVLAFHATCSLQNGARDSGNASDVVDTKRQEIWMGITVLISGSEVLLQLQTKMRCLGRNTVLERDASLFHCLFAVTSVWYIMLGEVASVVAYNIIPFEQAQPEGSRLPDLPSHYSCDLTLD